MSRSILTQSGGLPDTEELTAAQGDVLSDKTAYVSGFDDPVAGSMPDRGAVIQSLNCGGSYTIPAGYHNGGGRVTANSLASQTSGTATAAYLYSGKTAWVNGSKLTGSWSVTSALSFSAAAYSTSQVTCTWRNPAKGPYSGVIILYKTGGYPSRVSDGSQGYKGIGSNAAANGTSSTTIGGLSAGTTYYFRAWSYVTTSLGEQYGGYIQGTCAPTSHGSRTFTSSGSFTVPGNVRSIDICCVGGGGGTGGKHFLDNGNGGGGGGYVDNWYNISVFPGQQFGVVIGSGGVGNASGGSTSVGGYKTNGGGTNDRDDGGAGGSGGGAGGHYYSGGAITTGGPLIRDHPGHNGGSNGSNGNETQMFAGTPPTRGGIGQGFTTKAFSGTLYAGGGGGEASLYNPNGGAGGSGGGGSGWGNLHSSNLTIGSNGATNTGGGAGAGRVSNATGGSGVAIIRW